MFWRCKQRSTGYQAYCKECERIRQKGLNRRVGYNLHKKCISFLGGKCKRCGIDDIRVLQIDHINGGGKNEIVKVFGRSWRRYYRHVLADKSGKYQVLCANCNWIKKTENREGLQKLQLTHNIQ